MTVAARRKRTGLKSIRISRPHLAVVQGVYFLVTGLWPILSMGSFEAVSGKKVDRWLVKTVGALITVIGATLLLGRGDARRLHVAFLGLTIAAALAAVDLNYVARRRISPVYLLDAIPEMLFALAWFRGRED